MITNLNEDNTIHNRISIRWLISLFFLFIILPWALAQEEEELDIDPIDNTPTKIIRGLGRLEAADWSNDGAFIVTGGDIGAILWEVSDTSEPLQWYKGHTDTVKTVAFSPDGYQLLTGGAGQNLRLWYTETGEEVTSLTGHLSHIAAAAFLPDGSTAVTASLDNTSKLWDLEGEELLQTYFGHRSDVKNVAASPQGDVFVTVSNDREAILWSTESQAPIQRFKAHNASVNAVAFSSDGQYFITGSDDRSAMLWEVPEEPNGEDPQPDMTFQSHTAGITAVAISPDEKWVVTADKGGEVKIWDIEEDDSPLRTLVGHTDKVHTLKFFSTSRRLMTASRDGRVMMWSLNDFYPSEDPGEEPKDPKLGGGSMGSQPGETVLVPIRVQDLEPTKAFSFNLEYDPEILTYINEVSISNSLISDWGLADGYEYAEGKINVSAVALAGGEASGTGFLLFVSFEVNEEITSGNSLDITLSNLSDGLEGHSTSPIRIAVGFKGDIDGNGEVSPMDVQTAFDMTLNKGTFTHYQRWAADVNSDSRITPIDVQIIFEASLGRIDLSGKVNSYATRSASALTLDIGEIAAAPEEEVLVPVFLQTDKEIETYMLEVEYDRTKLDYLGMETQGTLSQSYGLVGAEEIEPALVRISAARLNGNAIMDSGILLHLRFRLKSDSQGKAPIHIVNTQDGLEDAEPQSGSITTDTSIDWMVY